MVSHSCLFKNPPPWMVVFAPLLIFIGFLGSGFFTLFLITSTVLILSSTVFLAISKHKPLQLVHRENSYHEDHQMAVTTDHLELVSKRQHDENQIQEVDDDHHIVASQASSPGCDDRSVSDDHDDRCLDEYLSSTTSEDSEIVGHDRSLDHSDGSISDEDSLIEIALPSGHYVGHKYYKEEDNGFNLRSASLHQKVPDLLPAGTIFRQRSLMELLAEINEMNEEENLIEIDISMGSIKCSRFEIEA